jgi:hypothetical protein
MLSQLEGQSIWPGALKLASTAVRGGSCSQHSTKNEPSPQSHMLRSSEGSDHDRSLAASSSAKPLIMPRKCSEGCFHRGPTTWRTARCDQHGTSSNPRSRTSDAFKHCCENKRIKRTTTRTYPCTQLRYTSPDAPGGVTLPSQTSC